jgi:hypothetical protein
VLFCFPPFRFFNFIIYLFLSHFFIFPQPFLCLVSSAALLIQVRFLVPVFRQHLLPTNLHIIVSIEMDNAMHLGVNVFPVRIRDILLPYLCSFLG